MISPCEKCKIFTKDKSFKKCWTLTRLGVQKHHKKLIGDGIDEKSKCFFKRDYYC